VKSGLDKINVAYIKAQVYSEDLMNLWGGGLFYDAVSILGYAASNGRMTVT
jgi:hypothetical protein